MTATTYRCRGADISQDGVYRYRLWREWGPNNGRCLFVMLNPSTADGTKDDATIRRCVGFADALGMGRLDVVNIYAYRATDPDDLFNAGEPQGPRNVETVRVAAAEADIVIAGWGARGGRTPAAQQAILAVLESRDLHALRLTKEEEQPAHPLYLPKSCRPFVWRERMPA